MVNAKQNKLVNKPCKAYILPAGLGRRGGVWMLGLLALPCFLVRGSTGQCQRKSLCTPLPERHPDLSPPPGRRSIAKVMADGWNAKEDVDNILPGVVWKMQL